MHLYEESCRRENVSAIRPGVREHLRRDQEHGLVGTSSSARLNQMPTCYRATVEADLGFSPWQSLKPSSEIQGRIVGDVVLAVEPIETVALQIITDCTRVR